ncbi:zinc-binding dehydrogenase [Paenibacillus naphthalenovorans]|uniref:zinc-dependent alcohol dehydrogenase n=1 Tax=Paenibacillus naphthalenovorans TaxID=162209 RepID=UPI0010BAF342|nr:alcohol dehydrogenase catalytic domain-containing protein [Paenibacillus naphthalenovorans]GCL70813.1 zinc-binding dehydrogenase [Paenibacillus naphthalenovorans]
MRAGIYLGEKKVVPGQLPIPEPTHGEALIRVLAGGICGTDMMIYAGKHPRAKAPLALGHEFCGVIEKVAGDSSFQPGERVVIEPTLRCGECEACLAGQTHVCKTLRLIGIDMDGGFAEYAKVPVHRLHRYPGHLSDSLAALTEPLAVAVHTVRRSHVKIGDDVVIIGCGPIGLLVGMVARRSGAGRIIAVDVSPYRIAKAQELGWTVLDARQTDITQEIKSLTGGKGADVVFEAAGTSVTAKQMTEVAKIQGQIVVVSLFKQPPTVDLAAMHFKELSLTTTRCYSRTDFQTAIALMAGDQVNLSGLISHELPLERIAEGFALMENPEEALKIIIRP